MKSKAASAYYRAAGRDDGSDGSRSRAVRKENKESENKVMSAFPSESIRKTKIIATIGPACTSSEMLRKMIEAGMEIARLNLSHGNPSERKWQVEEIRRIAAALDKNVAILVDTRGIEIRAGFIEGDYAELIPGENFTLYNDGRTGNVAGVSVTYASLAKLLSPGDPVLIDDGSIQLRVTSIEGDLIHCKIERGGTLGNRKGVNVPTAMLPDAPICDEDRDDLIFAAENKIDFVAASFVRSAQDIHEIRRILSAHNAKIPIIAKIENRFGVEHLSEILDAADGAMVARGDLGVELPMAEVPAIQKRIIHETVMRGKPVITATQMLTSMERHPRPTRAEVSDVANAILDGTSAVMLSGETASGRYPIESIQTMAAVAVQAEKSLGEFGHLQKILPHPSNRVVEAISQAATTMARHLHAAAIVCLTETGFTPRQLSKYRPSCPIIAVMQDETVYRQLALAWGIVALRLDDCGSDMEKTHYAIQCAKARGYVKDGDLIVITAGHAHQSGSTDLIHVVRVGEKDEHRSM